VRLLVWMLSGTRRTPFGHPETLREHSSGRTVGAVLRGANHEGDLMTQGDLTVRRRRHCAPGVDGCQRGLGRRAVEGVWPHPESLEGSSPASRQVRSGTPPPLTLWAGPKVGEREGGHVGRNHAVVGGKGKALQVLFRLFGGAAMTLERFHHYIRPLQGAGFVPVGSLTRGESKEEVHVVGQDSAQQ
jgi:hypothetical protein